jgi:hypothetical protein
MMHLSQEELIGQVYGEGAGIAARHLAGCAECSAACAALERDLAELRAGLKEAGLQEMAPPERDEAYGNRVWESIAHSLPAFGSKRRSWPGWGVLRGLAYAAVCGILAGGAFFAGRMWERRRPPAAAAAVNHSAPHAPQPIVVVVLGDHLDRSERLLVELKHADPGSSTMVSPLRDEARTLLAANRVCRKNAAEVDDPDLSTALDHLDRLLNELANQPGGLNARTIARLQDEMKSDSLLFEVRVLRSRLPGRQSGSGGRSKGGTI